MTDLRSLTHKALEAFWQVIVERFPEATSGDLSPENTIRLQVAAERAIKEWIDNNLPSKVSNPVDYDHSAIEALYAHLDKNWVRLDGYGTIIALSPDRQTLFFCPKLADGTPEPSPILPGYLNWGELTAPEDQAFLDAVNRVFGTSFCFDEFAGR